MSQVQDYSQKVQQELHRELKVIATEHGYCFGAAAATGSIAAGARAIRDLVGERAALEALYRAADALPPPPPLDVAAQRVPMSFLASRRARFWRLATDMLDRFAYVTAGLVLGAVFTLWH